MQVSRQHARSIGVFRQAGGVLRTSQALAKGIHPRELYVLRDAGILDELSRGVFRLAELAPLSAPDLVVVALRVPKAVVALISALHFHGLTTEIPHEVTIALPRGTAAPRLDWPPLHVIHLSGAMYSSGIETVERDGVALRVYGAAKTVADCFRFRNRIGVDVAIEALRTGLEERAFTPAEVIRAARIGRVESVVRPYLEAMT